MFNQPFRAHPISILEHFLKDFWVVVGIIIINIDDFFKFVTSIKELLREQHVSSFSEGVQIVLTHLSSSQLFISVLVLFLLIITPIFFTVRRWQKTWYILDNDDFIIKRQLLVKHENHLHCSDISNINLTQNVFERLTGAYKLQFDTNTSITADKTDLSIVLSTDTAFALRDAINTSRIAEHSDASSTISMEETNVVPWHKSSLNELLMHMACQISWGSIFISFIGLSWIITYALMMHFGIFFTDNTASLIAKDITESSFNWNWGILLPLLTFIVPLFNTTLGVFFRFYGFRVRRVNQELEVAYGFFTKRTYHLPINKINGLIYKQTLIQRIMGYASVEAINIGLGDGKNESRQILLSAHLPVIERYITELLPEFQNIEAPLKHQPTIALWYILAKQGITRLIIYSIALFFIPNPWKWFLWPLFITLPLRLYCAYRSPGIYFNEHLLIIAVGSVDRTITKLPWQAIEQASYQIGPLKSFFHLGTITYSILAHHTQSTHKTGLYKTEDCEKLYHRIDPDATNEKALS